MQFLCSVSSPNSLLADTQVKDDLSWLRDINCTTDLERETEGNYLDFLQLQAGPQLADLAQVMDADGVVLVRTNVPEVSRGIHCQIG